MIKRYYSWKNASGCFCVEDEHFYCAKDENCETINVWCMAGDVEKLEAELEEVKHSNLCLENHNKILRENIKSEFRENVLENIANPPDDLKHALGELEKVCNVCDQLNHIVEIQTLDLACTLQDARAFLKSKKGPK